MYVFAVQFSVLALTEDDCAHKHRENDPQRHVCVEVVPGADRHLETDEDQDRTEGMGEIVEALAGISEEEIHRPQPEDGECIGPKNDVGLVGDGKDGGHRIDREDDVGELNNDQRGKQWCRSSFAVFDSEELVAVELATHRHHASQQTQAGGLDVFTLVLTVADDLGSGVDEEGSEEDQDPHESADQGGADENEKKTEREGTEDPPEQNPMLVLQWNLHRREEDRPHKHIVDAQRLLDQVAADVLTEGFTAELVGDETAEEQPAQHPAGALAQRLISAGLMSMAVPVQIEGQHRQDHDDQQDPGPRRDAIGAGIPEVLSCFDAKEKRCHIVIVLPRFGFNMPAWRQG